MEVGWRRASAYVVCRDADERILLTRFHLPASPDDGMWTLPGGGMEWGETPEETAVREAREETGYTIRIVRLLGVYTRWFRPEDSARREPGHLLAPIYSATVVDGVLRTVFDDGDTTSAAGWFTLDELADVAHRDNIEVALEMAAAHDAHDAHDEGASGRVPT